MIRVLVVDDSRTARERVTRDLGGAPDVVVAAVATSGEQAIRLATELLPDVILMDLVMPGIDGCEATRAIMSVAPVPIIVMTGEDGREAMQRALDSGAVEFISKRSGRAALLDVVRVMAGVKVVGLRVRARASTAAVARSAPGVDVAPRPLGVVAIGASTGGPQAIQVLLSRLPPDLPVTYAIVLHIARGFLDALLAWLKVTSGPDVRVARHGESLAVGVAYIAPDEAHLELAIDGTARLTTSPQRHGHRPSVDVLFESTAKNVGARSLGLLMTGMGSDGARGLLAMQHAGATTITQDEASSVVYGMPRAAVTLGASRGAFTPEAAAAAIAAWARQLGARADG